jgi:hypothetical protein
VVRFSAATRAKITGEASFSIGLHERMHFIPAVRFSGLFITQGVHGIEPRGFYGGPYSKNQPDSERHAQTG